MFVFLFVCLLLFFGQNSNTSFWFTNTFSKICYNRHKHCVLISNHDVGIFNFPVDQRTAVQHFEGVVQKLRNDIKPLLSF